EKFPGIGPRQAGRFVQYLLRTSANTRREIVDAIQGLSKAVHQCPECMRFHAGEKPLCAICENPARDQTSLALVASDADLAALERSGTYKGRYFVLGGTVSLASEKATGLRLKQMREFVSKKKEIKEIILAFPANPE